jgi:hypothetical protein
VDSSSLRPPLDVLKPPVVDNAMQPTEGMDGYPVKVPIYHPTFDICMQMTSRFPSMCTSLPL